MPSGCASLESVGPMPVTCRGKGHNGAPPSGPSGYSLPVEPEQGGISERCRPPGAPPVNRHSRIRVRCDQGLLPREYPTGRRWTKKLSEFVLDPHWRDSARSIGGFGMGILFLFGMMVFIAESVTSSYWSSDGRSREREEIAGKPCGGTPPPHAKFPTPFRPHGLRHTGRSVAVDGACLHSQTNRWSTRPSAR